MTRTVIVASLLTLAAAGTTTDVFDERGERRGRLVTGPGDQMNVFKRESQRLGRGGRNADGSLELFEIKGSRIGEAWSGGIILPDPSPLRNGRGR